MLTSIYTSPIRNVLRRIGIAKVIQVMAAWRTQKRYAVYQQQRPAEVEIGNGNVQARMLVADQVEYARCLSFQEDQQIILAILERLETGSVYWDIGASIGIYTVLTAKKVGPTGHIVAFEPEKSSYQRLLENIEHNRLANVSAHNLALGSKAATMNLVITDVTSSGTHSLVGKQTSNTKNGQTPQRQTVQVLPGDRLRQDADLPLPNVVKVDVEGAEEDVLLGIRETLSQPSCHTVMCEVHFAILAASGREDAPKRIEAFLKDCGFHRKKWIDRSHLIVYK
jgi:FkbM family methyltransferase